MTNYELMHINNSQQLKCVEVDIYDLNFTHKTLMTTKMNKTISVDNNFVKKDKNQVTFL